jgi:hypothetical protein
MYGSSWLTLLVDFVVDGPPDDPRTRKHINPVLSGAPHLHIQAGHIIVIIPFLALKRKGESSGHAEEKIQDVRQKGYSGIDSLFLASAAICVPPAFQSTPLSSRSGRLAFLYSEGGQFPQ